MTNLHSLARNATIVFFVSGLSSVVPADCESVLLYERDDESGYIKIERIPADGRVSYSGWAVETSRGTKTRGEVTGDCEFVFYEMLIHDRARVVVETKDKSYYSVMYDTDNPSAAEQVATKLGLDIVHEKRRTSCFVIRWNGQARRRLERFTGQPKWPELRIPKRFADGMVMPYQIQKFANGGVFNGRGDNPDDLLYFDGVSHRDLAEYAEWNVRAPVVNETGDTSLYSFTLPYFFWKKFTRDHTTDLPGLGLSVSWDVADLQMIIVRDQAKDAANEARKKAGGNSTRQTQMTGS